jgi:Xaa-Pro dipeptidase
MKELFKHHIDRRLQEFTELLNLSNIDNLYIESGFPDYYFLDDQPTFFKSNPHFNFLCPDPGEGHILRLSAKGGKPTLFYHQPNDFWHEVSSLQGAFWEEFFDIKIYSNFEKAWEEAETKGQINVIISPNPKTAQTRSCQVVDASLISQISWLRAQKTEYEIECIRLANEKAAKGHRKAKEVFLQGGSERQIYMEYLIASGQRESEIPYNSIVAFDSHSAILHYQFPKDERSGQTFLIDAGARFHGYCSDITRTYTQDSVPSLFKELLTQVETNQKKLCDMVTPGQDYIDIHRQSYKMVAEILVDQGLFSGDVDEAIELKLPFAFYPHGIGHPLGLQVHDVGAKQKDSKGTPVDQPEDFPHLRTLRKIQKNDVLTIEPGFYFIPMLLDSYRNNTNCKSKLNWKLIDELSSYGGIRIEDNVVARKEKPENLTRNFLP